MDTSSAAARRVDLGLALGTVVVVALTVGAGVDAERAPSPVAYVFALGFGAVLLVRRRWPVAVLVVTVLGIFVYYALGFPAIGQALPAAAALYSAAELGRTRTALVLGGLLVGVAAYFRIGEGLPPTYLLGYELLTNVALVAAAVALGVSVRVRRASRADQERARVAALAEQAAEAGRRLQAQRVRIARDLHDSIGHTLAVVAVHAGVAAEAVGRDDEVAAAAIAHVRDATGSTLRELRSTVRLLRAAGDDDAGGTAGMGGVPALAESARAVGLDVDLRIDVADAAVDPAIGAGAYRIVQEALTNVLRHADARRVEVVAAVADGWLDLRVRDDGRGPDGAGGGGQGLRGMAERAGLLGGTLTSGRGDAGGFVVHARLPARLSS
ncbi:sensor histidine kinase [Cellulomonas wangsupingiae]|uniref:histidine kinase n=1 Tax=Cellulomonas wangsupingiae TaxID=2968085 RepID=A0ABY5K2C0_9CELL|nr:histidine kinase [Cellulomonas wangsupingiae]MCC2336176.1 histidine kinase [Cellulomonas wangsupingiae]MCM0641576.1 histidine kinase [Cellulomonas wangsupingiae]UUI64579.1 histidine kinase [Cellulomonas wangsupingiae]